MPGRHAILDALGHVNRGDVSRASASLEGGRNPGAAELEPYARRRASHSSSVRGQSACSSRDSERSASMRPPV